MPYANDFFAAYLTDRLDASGIYIPITEEARTDLLHFIGNDEYTYASLVNDTMMETVIIRNDHGTLILERGREGTKALSHPPGTCVRTVSPTIVAVIKDMLCNWKCCEAAEAAIAVAAAINTPAASSENSS